MDVMELEQLGPKLTKLANQNELEAARLAEEQKALQSLLERQGLLDEASGVLNGIAAEIEHQTHRKIAALVSFCLEAIFDEPYGFQIVFERKRGTTEARLVFLRDGHEIDPMTASGGGVLDVVSFALRLACLVLARPARRRILFLDEPFRFLSRNYLPRMVELLQTLADQQGVQILMVTHRPELQIGKLVEL